MSALTRIVIAHFPTLMIYESKTLVYLRYNDNIIHCLISITESFLKSNSEKYNTIVLRQKADALHRAPQFFSSSLNPMVLNGSHINEGL